MASERWIILAALALAAAAGLWLTLSSGDILMASASGTAFYLVLLFVMWSSMMLAMMLPSAAPAILTHRAMSARLAARGGLPSPPALFVAGYAVIWAAFSLAAMTLQLLVPVRLTGMMAVTSTALGATLLIAAGLYQMTPLKQSCLKRCQSPLLFFARRWREGALRMGLRHGIDCVACCWVLMGLLFYGGVMEPRWIVGLAVFVAAEKLIPARSQLSRFTGLLLIGWGAWVILAPMAGVN